MKKKLFALLTVTVLCTSAFAACGKKNVEEPAPSVEESSAASSESVESSVESTEPIESVEVSEPAGDVVPENTVAGTLYEVFTAEVDNGNTDLEQIARTLLAQDCFGQVMTDCMPVTEGYLNGFTDEVKGFSNGVMFAPMIGTIPFVGYLFETENPEELAASLKELAMLNWNICTEADEMKVEIYNNYVFFVMSPYSFN